MHLSKIEIVNAEIGTISSRQDHSVTFKVITPELLASQAGALMQFHGCAAKVTIEPQDYEPPEHITVTTEKEAKTPGQRLRAVLFLLFKQSGEKDFEAFYRAKMEAYIDHAKTKLT